MDLPKTGVITNQYGKTPTLPDNFQCKPASSPSKRFMVREAESIYGFM